MSLAVPRVRDPFDRPAAPRASSVQRVLSVVEVIPRGQVMSYGDIAALLDLGPREVARVMANQGDEVAWWRVLRSDGTCAPHLAPRQLELLRAEGVAMKSRERVDMAAARADRAAL
jgi:methylated-DNA-protein-cysteine methyltransferase-like protein